MDIEIRVTDWYDEAGIALRARQREEILIAKHRIEPGHSPTAEDMPFFLVANRDGQPVACAGLRPLALPEKSTTEPEAEIKRMYVVPECRGKQRGVADALMKRLEAEGSSRGFSLLKLETGADMLQARKFYERHGYSEIPRFGHYQHAEHSVCYEKRLVSGSHGHDVA